MNKLKAALRKIAAVPKSEIDRKLAEERSAKKHRPKR
jgi:hypothetical protein